MNITAIQARAGKVASKDYSRPALNAICVEFDGQMQKVVATDSYRLLCISRPSKEKANKKVYSLTQINQNVQIAKIKKTSEVELPEASDLSFPEWQKIKPSMENAHSVKLDRKYLIELLQAIDEPHVEITLTEQQFGPVVITAQGEPDHEYYGLLMPLRG